MTALEKAMQLTYDTEGDTLLVNFRDPRGTCATTPLADGLRFLHEDTEGLVSVEFIEVSRGISLDGLADAPAIAAALGLLRSPAA